MVALEADKDRYGWADLAGNRMTTVHTDEPIHLVENSPIISSLVKSFKVNDVWEQANFEDVDVVTECRSGSGLVSEK